MLPVKFTTAPAHQQQIVESACFHQWVLPRRSQLTHFYRTAHGYLLRFPDLGDYEVSHDGTEVICFPVPSVTEETSRHLFLNQVLPLALARQGMLVLHASAVEIGDSAVAFIGASGMGKSTLAASFATNGFRFLTDDGLLLEPRQDACYVLPSHPSIRLWDDSQDALIGVEVNIAPPVQFTRKVRFLAGESVAFCDQARPLRRIYFLGENFDSPLEFVSMSPALALIELVKHSFLLDIEMKDLLAAQFEKLSALVSQPLCYQLNFPRSFDSLAAIRQAIVEHSTHENKVQ